MQIYSLMFSTYNDSSLILDFLLVHYPYISINPQWFYLFVLVNSALTIFLLLNDVFLHCEQLEDKTAQSFFLTELRHFEIFH